METDISVRNKTAVLRISIDGEWNVEDFENIFKSLRRIYWFFTISLHKKQELFKDAKYADLRLNTRSSNLQTKAINLVAAAKILSQKEIESVISNPITAELELLVQLMQLPKDIAHYIKLVDSLKVPLLDELPDNFRDPLRVLRCKYSSPGITDLVGIAQAISQVKDFILEIIRHMSSSKDREIDRAIKYEELRAKKIKNAKDHLDLLRSIGYSEVELQRLAQGVDQCAFDLFRLASEKKITSVSEHDI